MTVGFSQGRDRIRISLAVLAYLYSESCDTCDGSSGQFFDMVKSLEREGGLCFGEPNILEGGMFPKAVTMIECLVLCVT